MPTRPRRAGVPACQARPGMPRNPHGRAVLCALVCLLWSSGPTRPLHRPSRVGLVVIQRVSCDVSAPWRGGRAGVWVGVGGDGCP